MCSLGLGVMVGLELAGRKQRAGLWAVAFWCPSWWPLSWSKGCAMLGPGLRTAAC